MSKHSRKRHCFPKKRVKTIIQALSHRRVLWEPTLVCQILEVFIVFEFLIVFLFLFVFVERRHVWLVILRPWSRGTSDLAQSHDRGRKGQVEMVLRRTNSRMRCQMG